jgi:hypothetical protein
MTYAPGDFSFFPADEAAMYKNAYDAVTAEGLWDFFCEKSPPADKGYMFWGAPELKKLDPHLEPIGHSGSSYGFTMRVVESIAKQGWEKFVANHLAALASLASPPEPEEDLDESPMPMGVPLARCGPTGPDPYAEDRMVAIEEAAAGKLCPVNQHGCMYFSASEWRFCPMCEWQSGAGLGRLNGTLGKLSVLKKTFHEESARGDDITLTFAEANQLLKDYKAFQQYGIHPETWKRYEPDAEGRCYFTRSEIHNLFMEHGCPMSSVSDESWAAIKAKHQ